MAGTAILKKQNTNSISKTANLNITFHSTSANINCCLRLQQLQVVESNNCNKSNIKNIPMKEYSTTKCHNTCSLDDRILKNYNYNIKKKQQRSKQRLLTLNIAVIIMSVTILLIQLPTMVNTRSVYEESATVENEQSVAETSAALDSKLLLSLLAKDESREQISSLTDDSSSDSLDMLTSLDVVRHIQRNQQHQRERRMRLRKRHTGDLIITKYLHETGHNLEWKNPCNVAYVNIEVEARRATKQQVYQYLTKFERDVGMEYELISATANTININDIADWSKHAELYKFLPKLNVNGSIALSRWYRNMQVYVASIGYLARLQYNFDQAKRMFVGSTSEELNKLLSSARFILCELEITINGSAPNNNLKKLKTISRRSMNNRLDFVTKHQMANGGVLAVNTVDLKFTKFLYYEFLLNMQKILKHKLRNKGEKYGAINSSGDNNTFNNNNIVVGDDTSSLEFSSLFKSDSSLSLGESVEILFKATKKPHTQRHRTHKRKSSKSTEI